MSEFDSHQKFRGFYVPRLPSNVVGSEPDTREISDDVQLTLSKLFGLAGNDETEIRAYPGGSLKISESSNAFTSFVFTATILTGANQNFIMPNGGFSVIAMLTISAGPVLVNCTFDGTLFTNQPANNVASLVASTSLIANVRGYNLTNTNAGSSTIQLIGSYRV